MRSLRLRAQQNLLLPTPQSPTKLIANNTLTGYTIIMTRFNIKTFAGLLAVATLTAVAGCATTADDEVAEALPDQGLTSDGDRFTCRRIQVTGTRQRERICYTEAEWEAYQERVRQGVDAVRNGDRGDARPAEFGGPGE
jgi:hypothetical protein